jgi:ABC-2 type transport system permease protein
MSWRNVATIAAKDLRITISKRSARLSLVIFPLVIAIGPPLLARFTGAGHHGVPAVLLPRVLDAFAFYFVIIAALLPTAIASYSMVGEKIERSLEPLLATPVTDGEVLAGKGIAALLPPLAVIWPASVLFMALCDELTRGELGHYHFPNLTAVLILLAVVPLAAVFGVEYSVLISSRLSDVRPVHQLATLAVLPFAGIYVAAQIGALTLDHTGLALIAGGLAVVDAALFAVTRATFRREEILIRWA